MNGIVLMKVYLRPLYNLFQIHKWLLDFYILIFFMEFIYLNLSHFLCIYSAFYNHYFLNLNA